jgi:hypothetical protein
MKRWHYIAAGAAFIIALITYVLTMQPTIPFWDCGEFAAAASAMQVPHPPGSPLWTIFGRLAMLLPLYTDVAARYNLWSAISSALSILILYLTLVRLLRMWRGIPQTTSDAIITFGGAFIGAMAYCWTDSFWFNALECEVYAFGSLFISLVPWLVLIWHDHAEEPHSEKYLMLIAFVIGLSLGVHQLALLTMFPVFMIVYYRRQPNPSLKGWLGMVALSVAAFILVFFVILSKLVAWAGSGLGVLSVITLAAIVGAIVYGQRKNNAKLALTGWSLAMVFLGYTTYMSVMVRGAQNPPMNENAPSTFAKLSGYINRTQYGDVSLSDEFFHRRLPQQKDEHANTWNNYTSDGDFFWRYQTNWMFNRYLAWNFIGRDGDYQGAGVDLSKTLALPFLLGLFGIYWHFKRDPKRALTLLGAFLILGYFVCWYQNQQDPQPRERDYFYVGAFYIFAMWVGIGAVGIMEYLKERSASWNEGRLRMGLAVTALALFVIAPLNQCLGLTGMLSGKPFEKSSKWAEYSRKNNWVPWEYAYNILQSCDANAILFTYGDNDTFPLWCLQDAYGIRRDVRIVQLQLATMMWNVKQLTEKNDWGADAVNLQLFTKQRLDLPDDNETYSAIQQARDWTQPFVIPVTEASAKTISGDQNAPAISMTWTPKIGVPSDFLVSDIISSNINSRPIYYSVTVPENGRAGLNNYLIYEGLVARVTPFKQPADNTGIAGSVQMARYTSMMFDRPDKPYKDAHRGMILTSYRNPDAHLSGMDEDYSMTYRYDFVRLADWANSHDDQLTARRALDTMEAMIPLERIGMDYSFAAFLSDVADKSGNWALTQKYAAYGAKKLREQMQKPDWSESNSSARPDVQLANLDMRAGNFGEARKEFETIRSQLKPNEQIFMDIKLKENEARRLEAEKKYDSAHHLFNDVLGSYGPGSPAGRELQDIRNHAYFDSLQATKH